MSIKMECINGLWWCDWWYGFLLAIKLNPVVTELFTRGRKLNISLVFISQSYFKIPKMLDLHCAHFFIMEITDLTNLIW